MSNRRVEADSVADVKIPVIGTRMPESDTDRSEWKRSEKKEKKVEPLGLSSESKQLGLCCSHLSGLGLGIVNGDGALSGGSSSEGVVQGALGRSESQLSGDVNVLDRLRVLAHHGVEWVVASLRSRQLWGNRQRIVGVG